jgi:hypothetical protein
MFLRKSLLRLSAVAAPLVAALAIGGPITQAAAPKIIIDDGTTADGCGDTYNGQTAQTNIVTAVANAANNTTIIVCPGNYTLSEDLLIYNQQKITIKAALTDPGKRPVLLIANGEVRILNIAYSQNTTIDGLVLDGRGSTETSFIGIDIAGCNATIKNTTVIGPDDGGTVGIRVTATSGPTVYSVSVDKSYATGYTNAGISTFGAVKLKVTSSYFDGTDGGRITGSNTMVAVKLQSFSDTIVATGSITNSRMMNNGTGVLIQGANKVAVANNMMANNSYGVRVWATASLPDISGTKITGNTILGTTQGITIQNDDAANRSITKTTISKNEIVSAQYGVASYKGIYVTANTTAGPNVTGTISQNTLMGFTAFIVFENATLTTSKNTVMP